MLPTSGRRDRSPSRSVRASYRPIAAVAKEIREELTVRVSALKKKGITPGLVMIRVGEDPASISYVTGKKKAADQREVIAGKKGTNFF